MLRNSRKQLDNHLKDAYEYPLHNCVLKLHASHWEPSLLRLLRFVRSHHNYSYQNHYISLGNYRTAAFMHSFDSSRNGLHNQLLENLYIEELYGVSVQTL